MQSRYPVIDVFAGPGGLGEGFSASRGEHDRPRFENVLSIEQDACAHGTLLLRHFVREFQHGELPDDYYSYLNGGITLEELYWKHRREFRSAGAKALKISLGGNTHETVRALVTEHLAGRRRWALVGGPPCQAYSVAGRSRMGRNPDFEQDERHFLYLEYLRLIIDHRPPVFVMENVKGLLSAKVAGKPIINRIVSDLSDPGAALDNTDSGLGYRLHSLSQQECPESGADPRLFLVRAEDYGVPQARHRMFIIGIRSDLTVRPRQLRRHKPPTVRQTIGNLPEIRSGLSRGADTPGNWRRAISGLSGSDIASQMNGSKYAGAVSSEIQLYLRDCDYPQDRASKETPGKPSGMHKALDAIFDPRLSALTGHEARAHMESDLRRYMYAAVFAQVTGRSPTLADFPATLLPDHRNVDPGRSDIMFSDRFRVQLPDQVATTLTSHISKDGHYFIHYDPAQCRSLTVREAARLQTFPDNYHFEGPRTHQYHQVGNAVPPYLACQIAEIIADVLDCVPDPE